MAFHLFNGDISDSATVLVYFQGQWTNWPLDQQQADKWHLVFYSLILLSTGNALNLFDFSKM